MGYNKKVAKIYRGFGIAILLLVLVYKNMFNEQKFIEQEFAVLKEDKKSYLTPALIVLFRLALTGGLLMTALVAPNALRAFAPLLRRRKRPYFSPAEARRSVRSLRRAKLVTFQTKGTDIFVNMTEKGRKKTLRYCLETMKIKKPARWDGRWRIVAFDIPEKKKTARNVFRQKIKDLGFKRLQKSVWAYKYPCRDEIEFLVRFYEIQPYVVYVEGKLIF